MMEREEKRRELHDKILALVREYADEYHKPAPWTKGARIPYAGRVYDHEEMEALVDSALEFWLTAGRYAAQFEKGLAAFLGTRHALAVNSGSAANLLAFMAPPSPIVMWCGG